MNMLLPRLTNCTECSSIPVLLSDIDCKMALMAKALYNNVVLSLNKPLSYDVMFSLMTYKRILTYKICNSEYAGDYTVEIIASKIKILKFK